MNKVTNIFFILFLEISQNFPEGISPFLVTIRKSIQPNTSKIFVILKANTKVNKRNQSISFLIVIGPMKRSIHCLTDVKYIHINF